MAKSKMVYLQVIFVLLSAVCCDSMAAKGSLTLVEIRHLKNPYLARANEDSAPINIIAKSDRFGFCKGGLTSFIGTAGYVAMHREEGVSKTKPETMKYMTEHRGLRYPFDAEQIADYPSYYVDKFGLEEGWKHPGRGDSFNDEQGPIFWEKCLKLPIEIFEAEYEDIEDDDDL